MVTENDFIFTGDVITESGYWGRGAFDREKSWTGNLSGILTKLIQVAGTTCKSYASDLFISWSSLEKKRKSYDFDGGRFLFGFREMGVDHNPYVLSRINKWDSCYDDFYLGGIYMLDVEVYKDSGERGAIRYQFGKVKLKNETESKGDKNEKLSKGNTD